MGFLKVCTEFLDGCGEIYLDDAVRLCAGKQRLTRNFHRTGRAFTKMTKWGFTSLAVPGHDPPIDITIFVDISVNPGPVSQTQVPTYYLTLPPSQQPFHLQIIRFCINYMYSRSQLLTIRV